MAGIFFLFFCGSSCSFLKVKDKLFLSTAAEDAVLTIAGQTPYPLHRLLSIELYMSSPQQLPGENAKLPLPSAQSTLRHHTRFASSTREKYRVYEMTRTLAVDAAVLLSLTR